MREFVGVINPASFGLWKTVENPMFWAAMRHGSSRLTQSGEYYWHLAKLGKI